ncbi:MAG: hypothetical protein AB9907_04775 [Flexilinea sp.]|jgi:hypothetical protein
MENDKEKIRKVFNIFWPLAISWLFMAVDNPSVSAIISRMYNPEICLAAHGGIAYPIALIIESPIIIMLSASIALCKDWLNYLKMYRFMMILCAILTVIHAAISFTPLYYVVVRDLIGAPEEILPYARTGLMIMLPWTWAIGYRRFYQGILIRCGFSKQVTIGTIVRMTSLMSVLFIGLLMKDYVSGTMVGAAALSAGVIAEAIYAGYKGRPVARAYLDHNPDAEVISGKELAFFYIPLVLTQFINFGWISIGSAAMSRMINPIVSLAVWPVLSGLLNILKSFGNACNEVTLTVLSIPGYFKTVRKFTFYVALASTFLFLVMTFTPLKEFWFIRLSALTDELSDLAGNALPLIFLIPFANAFLNFYQAILMINKKTKGILEALLVFFGIMLIFMGVGIYTQKWPGIYVILLGMNIAVVAQTIWSRVRVNRLKKGYQN